MAKGIFKLGGIDEYMERVQEAGLDILEAAELAVDAGSEVILDGMKRRVRKDTLNLHDHLVKEIETDGDTVIANVGVLHADADTARYGNVWEYTPGNSYVRAALDHDATAARRAMRESLKGMLE